LYAESLGAARTFARKDGYDIDPNQELRALAVANATSAIFHGMIVGGGTSGTAANDSNGAKSQVSAIAASLMVMLTLLFLTGWFYHLPEAVLAAIVVHAVWRLLDLSELRRFRRIRRIEYRESLAAIVGVLAFGILNGLLLAVILTLAALMRYLSDSHVAVLGRLQGTREYVDVARHPEAEQFPGILILRIERMLFFANADGIRQIIRGLVAKSTPPPKRLILNCELIPVLDVTAIDVLQQMLASAAEKHIRLVLAGVRDPVRDRLAKASLLTTIGEENIFRSVDHAVDALTAGTSAQALET
jgi:MFS superfamily sulfate permease-like transporter